MVEQRDGEKIKQGSDGHRHRGAGKVDRFHTAGSLAQLRFDEVFVGNQFGGPRIGRRRRVVLRGTAGHGRKSTRVEKVITWLRPIRLRCPERPVRLHHPHS